MLTFNETPFHFGPKVSCRLPGQLEATLVARATYQIAPGQAPTPVEDPIEQGFMSGDTWALDDPERRGALTYASDFADFKPRGEVYLKGTCYAPGGSAREAPVRIQVGGWSKTLLVFGPRAWQPGTLGGRRAGQAAPFAHQPLSWQNAYGGSGYAANPAGKGHGKDLEMPAVEHPGAQLDGSVNGYPASFLPLSPLWPQRAGKLGRKYGASWLRDRFPFYSEDFDFAYFQAAPEDQQLEGYLRGDEGVVLQNLHPQAPVWEFALPALRLRVFTIDDEQVEREVPMHLDTLYIDADAQKMFLTWRGLTPVRELDLTDLVEGLVVVERLGDEPRPQAEYLARLKTLAADPLKLEEKFPPGFLEKARQTEAEEAAELAADPPADGPPQLKDPFGIRQKVMSSFPPGFLAMADAVERGEKPASEGNPLIDAVAVPMAMGAGFAPNELQQAKDGIRQAWDMMDDEKRQKALEQAPKTVTRAAKPPPPPMPKEVLADLERRSQELTKRQAAFAARGIDHPLLGLFAMGQRLIDKFRKPLPAVPGPGLTLADLAQEMGKLDEALAETPEQPERPPEIAARQKSQEEEGRARQAEQKAAMEQLLAAFPPPEAVPGSAPDGEDFSGQDLSGQSFAGRELERANFSRTILTGCDFSGAKLQGASFAGAQANLTHFGQADLAQAVLAGADLTRTNMAGAQLAEADLRGVEAPRSQWGGARLERARLQGIQLTGADLSQASLAGADLTQAGLIGARLSGLQAAEAILIEADLSESRAGGADFSRVKAEGVNLERALLPDTTFSGADLRFARLGRADLRRAKLDGADLSLATAEKLRADELDLSRAKLDMANFTKSRLKQVKLEGAQGQMARFEEADMTGAQLSRCRLGTCSFSQAKLDDAVAEESILERASFRGVSGQRARFFKADIRASAMSEAADWTDAVFQQVQGQGSIWQKSTLTRANLSYAELEASHFQGCRGELANFYAANLRGAGFRKAELIEPQFVSCDLLRAELPEVTIVRGKFQSSNCYGVAFFGATLAECDFSETNLELALFDPRDEFKHKQGRA